MNRDDKILSIKYFNSDKLWSTWRKTSSMWDLVPSRGENYINKWIFYLNHSNS